MEETGNLAETLAREMKAPVEIGSEKNLGVRRIALPEGWTLKELDDEERMLRPRRKRGTARLIDAESFIDYVKRHGTNKHTTVWCKALYAKGEVRFKAILNGHGQEENGQNWCDHVATFQPEFSEEWKRWFGHDGKVFTQFEFAAFVEDNNKDIVGIDGPSGAEMLHMALNLEANQDVRFKSAIRLQSGGVNITYVDEDDAQTLTQMKLFERFTIGVPVYAAYESFQVQARLRYRVREGKLSFWYELVRPDKILEAATESIIKMIEENTSLPFFYGEA